MSKYINLLGKKIIEPTQKEKKFKKFFRKGLYAKKNISKFEKITKQNTIIRRPKNKFPIEEYDKIINKKSLKKYKMHDSILKKFIK